MLCVAIVHLVLVHRQHDTETLPNYQPLPFDSAGHVLKTVSLHKMENDLMESLRLCRLLPQFHSKHQCLNFIELSTVRQTHFGQFDYAITYRGLSRMQPKTLERRQHFEQYIDNGHRPIDGHLEWPNCRHPQCER